MVLFHGVRFVLAGFDEAGEQEFLEALEGNGGQHMGRYSASCTHVIVCELVLDDPICVAAQKDGKELVTDLWVADCLQSGTLIDPKLVLYRPLKCLNGIPGSDNLVLCLTGYQGQTRTDIVRMVDMMGARFTKPLVATKVTHLVCYKFEGEKYELAKRLNIKLVNHRWLEDCLLAWTVLPEDDYQRSGFDLEFGDAEAKDSEDNSGTPESSLRARPQNYSVTPKSLASQQGPIVSTPKRQHDSRERTPRSCASLRSKHLLTPSSRIRMLQSTKKGKQLHFQPVTSPGLCMAQHQGSPCLSPGNELVDRTERPSSCLEVKQGLPDVDHQSNETACLLDYQREGRQVSIETNAERCITMVGSANIHAQVSQELRQIPDESVSADNEVGGQVRAPTDHRGVCEVEAVEDLPAINRIQDGEKPGEFEQKLDTDLKQTSELKGLVNCVKLAGQKGLSCGTSQTMAPPLQVLCQADDQLPVTTGPVEGALIGVAPLVMQHVVLNKEELEVDASISNCNADDFVDDSAEADVKQDPGTNGRSEEACLCTANGICSMDKLNDDKPGPCSSKVGREVTGNVDEVLLGDHKCAHDLVSSETNTQVIEATALAVLQSFGNPNLGQTGDSPDDVEILQESRQLNQIIASSSIGGKRKLSETSAQASTLDCAKQEKVDQLSVKDKMAVDNSKSDQQHVAQDVEIKSKKLRLDPSLTTPTGSTVGESAQKKRVDTARTPKSSSKGAVSGLIRKLLGSENVQPELDFYDIEKELCEASGQGKLMPITVLQRGVNGILGNNDEGKDEEPVCSKKKPRKQKRAEVQSAKKNKAGSGLPSATPLKRPRIPSAETVVPKAPLGHMPETPAMVPMQLKRNTKTVKRPVPERRAKAFSDVTINGLEVPKFPKLVDREELSHDLVPGPNVGCKEGHIASLGGVGVGSEESNGINEWTHLFAGDQGTGEPAGGMPPMDVPEVQHQSKVGLPDGKETADGSQLCILKKGGVDGALNHDGDESSHQTTKERKNNAEHVGTVVSLEGEENTSKTTESKHMQMTAKEMKKKATKEKVVTRKKSVKEVESLQTDGALQETLRASENEDCRDLRHTQLSKKQATDATDPLEHEEEDKQKASKSGKSTSGKTNPQGSGTLESGTGMWFGIAGRTKEKDKYKAIIKKLGGKLTKEGHKWEDKITHLVLPSPLRRTEKFFAGAAAGRWLLRADYLEASAKAKQFVEELDYEWHGSGYNEDGNISLDAPRRWRKLREETGCGALHKLRIVIYGECTAPTQDTLSRVIKAGGGKVLSTSPPYDQYLSELDFALVNRDIPSQDKWISRFVDHGIACVAVDYLVDYVCKPSCSLEKHILHGTSKAVGVARKRLESNISAAAKAFTGRRSLGAGTTIQGSVQIGESERISDEDEDIVCSVCGKGDNGEVMMLCGDDKGRGCGVAVHIYCCKPPLQEVPVEDWFCKKCSKPPRKPRRANK